ncbi:MAG: sigma-70 family RNA polymerase sigma factor [Acidobacteriota bacterium]|nr:sigma-70 family RNA polymerase sigma factor [Acidobacteriota bacterium]
MRAVVDEQGEQDEAVGLRLGDRAAWASYYERVYPTMLAYAQRRLGSHDAASDAVAEALARTVATVARMSSLEVSPDAWGFGILRHVVHDVWRRRGRERRGVGPAGPAAPDPSELAGLSDEHRVVREAFDRLSATDREVLELRVIAQLSSEEVAAILAMSPGAVRMAQARAIGRLRAMVNDDGDDDDD